MVFQIRLVWSHPVPGNRLSSHILPSRLSSAPAPQPLEVPLTVYGGGEGPGDVTLSVVWVGGTCLSVSTEGSMPPALGALHTQRGLPGRGEREAWEAQRWGVVSEARV